MAGQIFDLSPGKGFKNEIIDAYRQEIKDCIIEQWEAELRNQEEKLKSLKEKEELKKIVGKSNKKEKQNRI